MSRPEQSQTTEREASKIQGAGSKSKGSRIFLFSNRRPHHTDLAFCRDCLHNSRSSKFQSAACLPIQFSISKATSWPAQMATGKHGDIFGIFMGVAMLHSREQQTQSSLSDGADKKSEALNLNLSPWSTLSTRTINPDPQWSAPKYYKG